jgi:phage tail-like protein
MENQSSQTPASLAHLPAMFQAAVAEPVTGDRLLSALLSAFDGAISSIDATIDDGAMYLDPLTTPAVPVDPIADDPQPTGIVTLKAMVSRAKSILAGGEYPAGSITNLRAAVQTADAFLAACADQRIVFEEDVEKSWSVVNDIARCFDALGSVALSLAERRNAMRPPVAVRTMKAIVRQAVAMSEGASAVSARPGRSKSESDRLGALIFRAHSGLQSLSARIERENAEAWKLARELWLYLPPAETKTMWSASRSREVRSSRSASVPPDFLRWLGGWVGVDVGEVETTRSDVSRERLQRRLVDDAAVLWRHRGTPRGLQAMLEMFYGVEVEILEWAWPEGMRIEHSSTIEVDTVLTPDADVDQSFVVVWRPPDSESLASAEGRIPLRSREPGVRRYVRQLTLPLLDERSTTASPTATNSRMFKARARKIYDALRRESPAHTSCYVALWVEEPPRIPEFEIEIHSAIGEFLLS